MLGVRFMQFMVRTEENIYESFNNGKKLMSPNQMIYAHI